MFEESELKGLSFITARTSLITAYKAALAATPPISRGTIWSSVLRFDYAALATITSIYVIVVGINCGTRFYPGLLFSAFFVTVLIAIDVTVRRQYFHIADNEVHSELSSILQSFEMSLDITDDTDETRVHPDVLLNGTTHSSMCTTYRNERWHRLPSLLLCSGDIVALMAGDLAPGAADELVPSLEIDGNLETIKVWRRGTSVIRGDKILLNQSTGVQASATSERHRIIASDSVELLALSGDVRCFQMRETPLSSYLANLIATQRRLCSVTPSPTQQTTLDQLYVIVGQERLVVIKVLCVIFLLGAIIRLALINEARSIWSLSTIAPLLCILMCFASSLALFIVLAETLVTSDFLALMEADLQLKACNAHIITSPTVNNPLHNTNTNITHNASTEQFDDDDIEERVEEAAAEVSSRVTTKRWLFYLTEVLKKRLGIISNRVVEMPIPFVRTRLLELLGSITFVAFVDDDVICEGYSIAEELLLLKSADGASDSDDSIKGLVLDLHASPQATGSRFESPTWWKHLFSLKPIGLNALLTYAPSPMHVAPNPSSIRRSLSTEGSSKRLHNSKLKNKLPLSKMEALLVSLVRRPIPLESLRELSEEIGFCDDDVTRFTRMLEVNMLVPSLVDRKLLEDTHAWGQDETRRRGTLVPELRGVIVHDSSNNSLQMMVHGTPVVLLKYCREYWDGASITSFDDKVKKEVLNVWDRWNLEDFDVIAFSYAPVPPDAHACIKTNYENNLMFSTVDTPRQSSPVLIFVDPSTRYSDTVEKRRVVPSRETSVGAHGLNLDPLTTRLVAAKHTPASSPSPVPSGAIYRTRSLSEPPAYRPCEYKANTDETENQPIISSSESVLVHAAEHSDTIRGLALLSFHASSSTKSFIVDDSNVTEYEDSSEKLTMERSRSYDALLASSSGEVAEETEDHIDSDNEMVRDRSATVIYTSSSPSMSSSRVASLPMLGAAKQRRKESRNLSTSVFPILKHQVFLGMAACSVPVRQGVSQLMEDLTDAGIRFIYFSPRNMRRSKPVAAKIGIPFDWNCAISLRELGEDEKDPFRHISSYADWDVHARMPHGVRAIRKHLAEVDNVPLLVSLYTDSTPSSIKEIVQVFKEYGEVVLTIGSSHRLTNRDLFYESDLACGVSMLPGEQKAIPSHEISAISSLPTTGSSNLCRADLLLTFRLISLNSSSLLQIPCPMSTDVLDDNHHQVDLSSQLDFSTILEAVRVGRSFVLNAMQCLAVICICIVSLALVPIVALLVPLSLTPFIPLPLLLVFLFFYIPIIGLSILFTKVNAQDSVMKNTPRKRNGIRKPKDEFRFKSFMFARCLFVAVSMVVTQWIAVMEGTRSKSLTFVIADISSADMQNLSFYWTIQDVNSAAALLAMLSQSCTLLHRGQFSLPTFNNSPAYCICACFCLVFHGLLLLIRALLRVDGMKLYAHLHWGVWVTLCIFPLLGILVGYIVNVFDNKHYRRYLQFLRLEFDTKLGMHSPR